MAIARANESDHRTLVYWEKITPKAMSKAVFNKTDTVFVGRNFLTIKKPDNVNVQWCGIITFKKAYPEEWGEIQAELALQKLKDSGI